MYPWLPLILLYNSNVYILFLAFIIFYIAIVLTFGYFQFDFMFRLVPEQTENCKLNNYPSTEQGTGMIVVRPGNVFVYINGNDCILYIYKIVQYSS